MEFGQRFLISSELLESFWTDVLQQETSIQSITNTVSSALQDNTPDHVRQVFMTIFTSTQQAIKNHERVIAGTISLENADGVCCPD
jgi:DNA repair protein RadC